MGKVSDYGEMLLEHRGKWVALAHDESRIVATGKSLSETIRNAEKTDEKAPIYVMVSKKVGSFSF